MHKQKMLKLSTTEKQALCKQSASDCKFKPLHVA